MSVAEVTARIAQLQQQLAALVPTDPSIPATSGGPSAGEFASAMRAVTPTAGSGRAGAAVVADARKYLGVPYVWGGTDPKTGLDCSGLVQRVYADLGYDLPRVSHDQANAGRPVDGLQNAQPGDVLAFGSPVHHVAIYIGGGKMIEAPHPGADVRVSDVYETPTAIRRILPDPGSTTPRRATSALDPTTPYAALFESASARTGVPADLIAAVAEQESGFDPKAVSPAGATGLMQLMPATAHGLGVTDATDPAQAINGGADYLRSLLDRFGSTSLALAAYNAGPGAVLRYGGIPPYPETQRYVSSVLALQERL